MGNHLSERLCGWIPTETGQVVGQEALTLVSKLHASLCLRVLFGILYLRHTATLGKGFDHVFALIPVFFIHCDVPRNPLPGRIRLVSVLFRRAMDLRLLHPQDSSQVSPVRSQIEKSTLRRQTVVERES